MTPAQLAIADAWRSIWVALAMDAGIDPQVAVDGHRELVANMGIEEQDDDNQ